MPLCGGCCSVQRPTSGALRSCTTFLTNNLHLQGICMRASEYLGLKYYMIKLLCICIACCLAWQSTIGLWSQYKYARPSIHHKQAEWTLVTSTVGNCCRSSTCMSLSCWSGSKRSPVDLCYLQLPGISKADSDAFRFHLCEQTVYSGCWQQAGLMSA